MNWNRIILLLALLTVNGAVAAPPTVPPERILMIEASSAPITAGRATLTVGVLQRTNDFFTGDYRVKVFPYFYKSERGRLAIAVSDTALAEIRQGKVTRLTGTATTNGKGGRCRPVVATVTPAGPDGGRLQIRFTAGGKPMLFEPAYHIAKAAPGGAATRVHL